MVTIECYGEHHDPAEQSVRVTEDSGLVVDQREETTSGAKIEPQDPYPTNPNFTGADTDGQYPFVGTVGKPTTGCVRDGVLVPDCSWIFVRIHSTELAEASGRASALKLLGYDVATNHFLLKHFGLDLQRAIGEAYEQGHNTVIRNLQVNDSAFAGSYLFPMQSQKPKPVDWAVLQSALKTCIHKLWPMFEMTSFNPTTGPPKKGKKGEQYDAAYNGVIGLKDLWFNKSFSIVNDPTPSADVRDDIIHHQSRGRTDPLHPFWTYAYPPGDPNPRPGELRYPELFGQPSMDY